MKLKKYNISQALIVNQEINVVKIFEKIIKKENIEISLFLKFRYKKNLLVI